MFVLVPGIGEMKVAFKAEGCWRAASAAFASALALCCLVVVLSVPSLAETQDVYTVRDVPVDATANEAAEARVIAIRHGRATALRMLFQRLTLEVDWSELPALDTSEVTTLGAGFEISNERNSPTRYLATITYRFKPKDVREILQQFDIPFSEVQARPMVVLPVYIEGNNARIFQDDHNWSLAWSNKHFGHELVPIKIPLGDLGDVIATPVEAALTEDYAALSGFAERYGVQDILLVRMRQKEPKKYIIFEFVRLSPTESETWSMTVPHTMHIEPLMRMAIDRGLARLQEDWKARTIIRFDAQETLVISARFEEISQWLIIKRAMQGTPNITDSRLVALSTGGAHMEWDVVGSPSQLALALAQHGVALEPSKRGDNPAYTAEPDELEKNSDYPNPWGKEAEPDFPPQWDQNGNSDYDPFGSVEADTQDRVSEGAPVTGDPALADDWADGLAESLQGPDDLDDPNNTDEAGDAEEPREPLDAGAALALLPVATKGGFYAATSDTQGTDFGNINPDFWIVRFAPKAELEVWPTEGQEAAGETEAFEGQSPEDSYNEGDLPDYDTAPDGAF